MIGAVLVHGAKAPYVIRREQLSLMKRQAVLVDVSIDQGGCFETSRPTTHSDPIYEVDGVLHYCVANMPGAVPVTSTRALTNATLPVRPARRRRGRRAGRRARTRAWPRASTSSAARSPTSPWPRRPASPTRSCSRRWRADALYDAVIIGAGHNGLVAAAYLARAGQSVLVLERSDHVGGAAVSERPWAGVDARLSRYSYLVSLLPRAVARGARAADRAAPALGLLLLAAPGRQRAARAHGRAAAPELGRVLRADRARRATAVFPTLTEPLLSRDGAARARGRRRGLGGARRAAAGRGAGAATSRTTSSAGSSPPTR